MLLPKEFCLRSADEFAKELLGAILVRSLGDKTKKGMIVETEAYFSAIEPLEGIEEMIRNRGKDRNRNLADGSGKLTKAMGITNELNGTKVYEKNPLMIEYGCRNWEIGISKRIGVDSDLELRFFLTLKR